MSLLCSDGNFYFQTHDDFHFYAAIYKPRTVNDSIQATEANYETGALFRYKAEFVAHCRPQRKSN